jgi:hypothetical protein
VVAAAMPSIRVTRLAREVSAITRPRTVLQADASAEYVTETRSEFEHRTPLEVFKETERDIPWPPISRRLPPRTWLPPRVCA